MFTIQLSAKNIPLEDDVKRLTNEKLKKLEKHIMNFPQDALKAIIMLKKRTHRSDDSLYTTTIALYVPSRILHAHYEGYSLEDSLIGAVDDIEEQLEEYKEKLLKRH